jgi:hypothetical protein
VAPVRSANWLLVPALLLASCKPERQQARGATAAVSAQGAGSTAPAPSTLASSHPTSDDERSLDLLQRTASVVVTSSHAEGSSTAAYLIDQLPETSWKANPPDQSPWIEIDLPAPATIERVELILAQPASSSLEAVSKAARLLVPDQQRSWLPQPVRRSTGASGELVLAPGSPTVVARLRISLQGAPRGLRVAELRAIGSIAESELLAPAMPETQVQGHARVDYAAGLFAGWVMAAPYANEEAICAAFVRALPSEPEGQPLAEKLCRKLPDLAVSGVTPNEMRAVQRYQLTIPDPISPSETTALVVRGERGLYPANLALADNRNEGMCPGGPEGDMSVSNFRFEHGVLLIDRTRYFTPGALMLGMPNVGPAVAAASIMRCQLTTRLSCRDFITRFGAPITWRDENGMPQRVTLPTSWAWSRTLSVTRRGTVRLGACRGPDGKDEGLRVVPCLSPGAELL